MTPDIRFRPFKASDRDACLAIFDANCPEFFAPNERDDYADFLNGPTEAYEVCLLDKKVVGAFGLFGAPQKERGLSWILLDPGCQGAGVGSQIMSRILKAGQGCLIHIGASHKSAPFFERFGAVAVQRIEDGWGPGMHRVDMELQA